MPIVLVAIFLFALGVAAYGIYISIMIIFYGGAAVILGFIWWFRTAKEKKSTPMVIAGVFGIFVVIGLLATIVIKSQEPVQYASNTSTHRLSAPAVPSPTRPTPSAQPINDNRECSPSKSTDCVRNQGGGRVVVVNARGDEISYQCRSDWLCFPDGMARERFSDSRIVLSRTLTVIDGRIVAMKSNF